MRHPCRDPRGMTLVELLVVIAMLAVLAAITVRGLGRLHDAMAVGLAARRVADLLATARDQAVATGMRTAVRFDGAAARVVVHAGGDTIAREELGAQGGVRLEASRDSMAYTSSGLGYGAANLRVVLFKGASADTVTVSRLGRVRR